MSEEEIIRRAEIFKKMVESSPENERNFLDKIVIGLLDLYNKEKEKNTNLELCLKSEEKYSEGLNRDIKSLLNIEPNNNFISKDKIREKIDILNKTEQLRELDYLKTKFAIEILQELLGGN